MVSIKIKKGFNQSGAPSGKRCAVVALMFFMEVDKINDSHSGNPKESVKIKWLEVKLKCIWK